jgi:hypothetical protein
MSLLYILAIWALSYWVRELTGPFNIFSYIRKAILHSFAGPAFYKLISCPFCLGFHIGWFVYLLQVSSFDIRQFILFGLAGSAIVAFGDALFNKIR